MNRREGNVSELLATCICILGMTAVMMSYMGSMELVQQKMAVNQLARRYILRMETVGYLTEADRISLQTELQQIGVANIDLSGTTLKEVAYGEPISLYIKGKLKGQYEFEEKRASTAKN